MKTAISSAVLGAAIFGQTALSATIGHSHGHVHRRAPAVEKRAVEFLSTADASVLTNQGILVGKNVCQFGSAPITINDKGPFVTHVHNKAPVDIVLLVWSTGADPYLSSFVKAQQADITHTIPANSSAFISFDPSQAPLSTLSGAMAALYPGDSLSQYGQVDSTWVEYTYTVASQFSTTDVSRAINMNGRAAEVSNYATKADAEDDNCAPACSSTMDKCSFVCPEGQTTCMVPYIQNCPAGTPNTSSDGGLNGGCTGMTQQGGWMDVTFY